MGKFWQLKQQNDSTLELYLYDDIQKKYTDFWGDSVGGNSNVDTFKSEMDKYPNANQINVYINSNGGDVMEAYGMLSILERHPAKIHVFVDGFACSASSLFLCIADKVTMAKQATVMIHNMMSGCYGNANDFRKMADDLDKLMEANRKLYLSKMNITEDELIELLDNETYFTAQECLENGLCDEISGNVDIEKMERLTELNDNALKELIARRQQTSNILKQLKEKEIDSKEVEEVEQEKSAEDLEQENRAVSLIKILSEALYKI